MYRKRAMRLPAQNVARPGQEASGIVGLFHGTAEPSAPRGAPHLGHSVLFLLALLLLLVAAALMAGRKSMAKGAREDTR